MVKEENLVEDVEEGEISDAMSIEEISEEDFNKQEEKKTKEVLTKVWTMGEFYKYQVEKGHNVAPARAVQKKPLSKVVMMFAKILSEERGLRESRSPNTAKSSQQ
ncbi:hypothetical protein NL676_024983 [Syzygium grande]|nr:hypothetical protein NL676_024983 [Syzygium grande]